MEWAAALLIKPFGLFILFALVVVPLAFLFRRFIPESRIKTFLYLERTREDVATADKGIMVLAVIVGYALLLALGAYLSS